MVTGQDDAGYDVVVVGGGAAGLAAAWHLRDRQVLLLESADRLGGRMHSVPRGARWINLGCHLFPGPGSTLHGMLGDLDLRTLDIPGVKTAIAVDGRLHASARVETHPLTLPLTLRERISLARAGTRLLRAVHGYFRQAAPRSGDGPLSRRTRLDAYLADRSAAEVLGPLPPRVQDLLATAGRRAASELADQSGGVAASLFASVWGGSNAFATLNVDGGTGELPRAVGAALADRVRLSAEVLEVAEVDGGVRVRYRTPDGEQEVRAEQVVVAVPAPVARKVVRGLPPRLDTCLREVAYGPFVSMGLLTDPLPRSRWDRVYATTTPGSSFSMMFNHTNPVPEVARRTGASYMVYAGGAPAAALLGESDATIEARFTEDLLRIHPALRGRITETVVHRWPIGNTYRRPGFDAGPLHEHAERHAGRIRLAGDYFVELGNVEQAATTGLTAARHARAALAPRREARPADAGAARPGGQS
ncbi:hypothetical protein GCM10022222_80660 [Amycolatopsis ultiminotia]|uniref:Amine oxidase domain-containing protein n=1 Tax=Amycolatopsis ultiminotia TaxID=543629 RepID=A0ABP6YHC7_9PSEU